MLGIEKRNKLMEETMNLLFYMDKYKVKLDFYIEKYR